MMMMMMIRQNMTDAPPFKSRGSFPREPLGKLYACLQGLEGLTSEYSRGEMVAGIALFCGKTHR